MDPRQTSFSDVCGTVDELKRLLREGQDGPDGRSLRVALERLLDDAAFMLRRMGSRIEEYGAFRDELQGIVDRLAQIEAVDTRPAAEAIASLRERVRVVEQSKTAGVRDMAALAEAVRAVANAHEHCLRRHKELALATHEVFAEVQGERPWLVTEDAKPTAVGSIRKRYQAWLPPGPHGDRLVDWLSRSRVHVLDEPGPDGEPRVQFEDGGCMAMSQVRWDSDVENFHPASFRPGATGRRYRGTQPEPRTNAVAENADPGS